jgi:hypothetical protein
MRDSRSRQNRSPSYSDPIALINQFFKKLFGTHIDETCLEAIRNNANKGWGGLGNERLKEQTEQEPQLL